MCVDVSGCGRRRPYLRPGRRLRCLVMPAHMKPTEVKQRTGNPGKRPLPDPILIGGRAELADLAEPPEDMPADAAEFWRRTAPDLIGAGILDRSDVAMFEDLCRAFARKEQFGRVIAAKDLFSPGSHGQIRQAPWVIGERQAAEEFRKLGALFGLSPVDRARLGLATLTGLSMAAELDRELAPRQGDPPVWDAAIDPEDLGVPGL